MEDRKIIGFVGPIASGKSVVVGVLAPLGYRAYSLSDRVREEAHRRVALGKLRPDFDRADLQDIGNDFRATEGGAALAKRTWALIEHDDARRVAIESIRNPEEIHFLQSLAGWTLLIGINATPEKRFRNMLARAKRTDPKTWEEFLAVEGRDRGAGESALGQQVDACLALADITLQNNGTREEFEAAVLKLIAERDL